MTSRRTAVGRKQTTLRVCACVHVCVCVCVCVRARERDVVVGRPTLADQGPPSESTDRHRAVYRVLLLTSCSLAVSAFDGCRLGPAPLQPPTIDSCCSVPGPPFTRPWPCIVRPLGCPYYVFGLRWQTAARLPNHRSPGPGGDGFLWRPMRAVARRRSAGVVPHVFSSVSQVCSSDNGGASSSITVRRLSLASSKVSVLVELHNNSWLYCLQADAHQCKSRRH
jgi:hypothetical protein